MPQSSPSAAPATPFTGTIKMLKKEKGYGFIQVDGGKTEVFFHADDLLGLVFDTLEMGDRLSGEWVMEDKGPRGRKLQEAR